MPGEKTLKPNTRTKPPDKVINEFTTTVLRAPKLVGVHVAINADGAVEPLNSLKGNPSPEALHAGHEMAYKDTNSNKNSDTATCTNEILPVPNEAAAAVK